MLAPALRRHGGLRALDDLEQRLLHALAGDVARDGDVLALLRDLVDLVDIDNADLRLWNVIVRGLDQLEQNILDILADIACLCQGRRVRDRERDADDFGERLCQVRLAGSGRPEHQNVALLQLYVVLFLCLPRRLDSLVMIVHRDGEDLLGLVLPDDILVQKLLDFHRRQ